MRSSHSFLDLAKSGINSPFRVIIVLLFSFLWTFPSVVIALPLVIIFNQGGAENILEKIRPQSVGLAVLLLPFVTALYGLCRQIPRQHGRDWLTIVTPKTSIDWRKIALAGIVWGVILLADFAVQYSLAPERFTWSFQPMEWVLLVIVSFLLIPLQAGFEELAFRGYLMQKSALVLKRVWQPLLLTSVAFGLLHGANPEVSAYGYVTMIGYIGTGLILGLAVIMDEGLEIAIGAHAANNIVNALLVTETNSVFQTPSLFQMTSEQPSALWLLLDTAIPGAIFLIIMAKIYRWGSWKRLVMPIWDVPEAEIAPTVQGEQ